MKYSQGEFFDLFRIYPDVFLDSTYLIRYILNLNENKFLDKINVNPS